ncbi:Na(+)-translocating NADH-quinone reductase subunit F [Winogradskyella aurantia]|uniref:Na(+)-translocating NADH-quinone reductase subunit F n=1 Tax=Winogradskyella aurantia TaxID=1915063 RepID=A0A265UVF5_9FLAO|nr:Na(+)-translocating NADH-quinone reductase subunit F [Winogradskyella aurantia]OZV69192.1 Na(+)-translocating NADH-quinone reductase subunit F [Winogradskyella aurantia]
MISSNRFNHAITKLYEAFHNNTLNPDDFKQCAVGNLLDNTDSWQHLTDKHGSLKLNYVGLVHQNLGRRFKGYTPLELLRIESSFLSGCGYKGLSYGRLIRPENTKDKDVLFNGLCEVVETLCQLDGTANIMNCDKLFDFEKKVSLQPQN